MKWKVSSQYEEERLWTSKRRLKVAAHCFDRAANSERRRWLPKTSLISMGKPFTGLLLLVVALTLWQVAYTQVSFSILHTGYEKAVSSGYLQPIPEFAVRFPHFGAIMPPQLAFHYLK